ncbi:Maf family protein [Kangiella geojedonensis]|mgnify:FL=1|uniref:dTTP/UTP pyrophosphatase n=1 Tax=Kangiella geojedonensis TaxID=914150 RepID=A0A0F6TS65_9GAMM|nr:nucleoside triphosphate pyrophosphatase [Kangiella geojedonensis]AKE52692.1 septum formation inhibitor Maf [Kangiella geojedonensis]
MSTHYSKIYLASGSPRRKELLTQLGVDYIQIANDFDETRLLDESPLDYVERVALGKAQSALKSLDNPNQLPILSADTTVAHQGEPLGKPNDLEHAAELLLRLSGDRHTVMSSVVLAVSGGFLQKTVKTDVVFAALKQKTIEAYCQTQEPLGKAGGYAIQGIGGSLIETISGSYTNVVGLPVYETRQLLEQAKVQFALSGLG